MTAPKSLKKLSDGQYNLLARCYIRDRRHAAGDCPYYLGKRYDISRRGEKVSALKLVQHRLVEYAMGGLEIGLLPAGRALAEQIPERTARVVSRYKPAGEDLRVWKMRDGTWESWGGHQFLFCEHSDCPGHRGTDPRFQKPMCRSQATKTQP